MDAASGPSGAFERLVITGADVIICGAAVFAIRTARTIGIKEAVSIIPVAQCIPTLESDINPWMSLDAVKAVHAGMGLMMPSTFIAALLTSAIYGQKEFWTGAAFGSFFFNGPQGLAVAKTNVDLLGVVAGTANDAYSVFPEARTMIRQVFDKPGLGEIQNQLAAPQRTDAPNAPELERGPLPT